MKLLMCRPTYYEVDYIINPWMQPGHSNQTLAVKQWERLKQLVEQCGGEVSLVEPVKGLPDMVFTANAGLVYNNKVFLSNFKYTERQNERAHYQHWFKEKQWGFYDDKEQFYFEGEGDALFLNETLFFGHGFRSELAYNLRFSENGIKHNVNCELVNPYFYHLDTCFCPISATHAIWWPEAFSKESQKAMAAHVELVAVPENEAKRFACNAVVIEDCAVIPSGCPETRKLLEGLGKQVHDCDMSEFIVAGGACKCLVLVLESHTG